ncbi:hypothetical protein ACIRYZ_41210 [Kitasatospora sp. NPDC101155]|uniref:hypothetical protein n=1 Tax=Kitasatospora sp. NPDC101155 TaxID=3364097 RepID=UPI0037FBFE45
MAAALLTGCSSGPGPVLGAPGGVTASTAATTGGFSSPGAVPADTPTLSASGAPAFGSPSSTPSGPPIPTGAFLRSLLPTAATLPAGWTIESDGGETDTGTYVDDEPGDPMLPKERCTEMRLGGGTLTHDLQASDAENHVSDGMNEVFVRLSAYHPGDAAKVLAEIRDYAARCKSFTGQSWDHPPVPVPETVTVQPVPGLGEEAIDMKKVPTGPYQSEEIIVIRLGDRLLSLSGNNIVERLPHLMELATPLSKTAR